MRRGGRLVVVACLAGPAWVSAGQETPGASPPAGQEPPSVPQPIPGGSAPPIGPVDVSPPADAAPQPETEITIDKGTRLGVGVGFSHPMGAVASVRVLHGLAADVRDSGGRVRGVCAVPIPHCARGFLFQAEAGSGGGEVSLGLGARSRVEEEGFHGTVGVGLRAVLARTWGHPIGTEPGLTYLGPELDLSILRVELTLGVLWRVSGDEGASALFGWGLGFVL